MKAHYDLTLFVSGASELSQRAIANVRVLCDTRLGGRVHLTILDLQLHPELALEQRVIAAPTLVRNRPFPVRRLIGDLSDLDRVCLALELPAAREPARSGV